MHAAAVQLTMAPWTCVFSQDESPVIETTAQQQGSKSQSQLQIDNQWVADYAKQLVALCTGGEAAPDT